MAKQIKVLYILTLILLVALSGCGKKKPAPTATPTSQPTAIPSPVILPKITAAEIDHSEVQQYEPIEWILSVDAEYTNPFDLRQVSLDGIFTRPDRTEMAVSGFWDGEISWRLRFTPSQVGEWSYQFVITDHRGVSEPVSGKFMVTSSSQHGWLQVGKWVNPSYSNRYLVYHDGTPFYGIGHCDALTVISGYSAENGFPIFDQMKAAGENYVVWWPLYTSSPILGAYDQYSLSSLKTIDMVVRDAQKKGVFLIFTVWDHNELRDATHAWGAGRWMTNGFSKLTDITSFFTSEESWVWQANFYHYIIARWGYSPAIGMWQTVSEINGTNSYGQTNPWHDKVNAYFIANDPYRHPTTASMSGDVDWPEGFKAMDAPQVHVYDFRNDPLNIDAVKAGQILADWTQRMWDHAEKPNWVGEFGVPGNTSYPELFHNSIWAALGAGAAMTPAEWNDNGSWMEMSQAMNEDIKRLGEFVAQIPLAQLNPVTLDISSNDPQVRAWGVAGKEGGLFWVQDFSLEGKPISEVRKALEVRKGVELDIEGMTGGTYTIYPYDTWQGTYLESYSVICTTDQACTIPLPDFKADMAFKVERQ